MQWRVVMGLNNRPYFLICIEPGHGVRKTTAPPELVEYVRSRYGEFDATGGLAPGQFSGLGYRDLDWPLPKD